MGKSVMAMILAGGEGRRLRPLTAYRAKPSVPFGGKYRIIDFVLSNFINSDINSIFVLTQFRSQSLMEHIINGWNRPSLKRGHFIIPVPAQQIRGERWYDGTADAIFQNIHLVDNFRPDIVAVFGGDHIYRMDVSQMLKFHEDRQAYASIAAIPVPLEQAKRFGVIQVDEIGRITGFQEKPDQPKPMPGNPNLALASMGNYLFNRSVLYDRVTNDARDADSDHDFGKDILPALVSSGKLFAYNFYENKIPGQREGRTNYWRDIGTMDAYFDANMDLRTTDPQLDLYNAKWPIHSYQKALPPAKFVHNDFIGPDGITRIGRAINSIVSDGCIISGALVEDSVLYSEVRVHSYTTVKNCIIMDRVEIPEHCQIRNAVIDKHVTMPTNTRIGYDKEEDIARGYAVLDRPDGSWLTIIPKDHKRRSEEMVTGTVNI